MSGRRYAALLVSAMQLGFTYADLRHMPYHRLMWAMEEWRRMNEPEKTSRAATQADIDMLLH